MCAMCMYPSVLAMMELGSGGVSSLFCLINVTYGTSHEVEYLIKLSSKYNKHIYK